MLCEAARRVKISLGNCCSIQLSYGDAIPHSSNGQRPVTIRQHARVDRAARTRRRDEKLARTGVHQPVTTSTIAWAKACGASCGRLCPMPPLMVRCAYLPENFLA